MVVVIAFVLVLLACVGIRGVYLEAGFIGGLGSVPEAEVEEVLQFEPGIIFQKISEPTGIDSVLIEIRSHVGSLCLDLVHGSNSH